MSGMDTFVLRHLVTQTSLAVSGIAENRLFKDLKSTLEQPDIPAKFQAFDFIGIFATYSHSIVNKNDDPAWIFVVQETVIFVPSTVPSDRLRSC